MKAEKSALIDRHIEAELLKNLNSGKYKDIWNISQKNWEKVLDKTGVQEEHEEEFDSEEIDNIFVSDLYGNAQDADEEEPVNKKSGGKKYSQDDDIESDEDKSSKKTNNTSNISGDKVKKMINKKRTRNDKKGKLNMEYEYEDKNKEAQNNYNNDW